MKFVVFLNHKMDYCCVEISILQLLLQFNICDLPVCVDLMRFPSSSSSSSLLVGLKLIILTNLFLGERLILLFNLTHKHSDPSSRAAAAMLSQVDSQQRLI